MFLLSLLLLEEKLFWLTTNAEVGTRTGAGLCTAGPGQRGKAVCSSRRGSIHPRVLLSKSVALALNKNIFHVRTSFRGQKRSRSSRRIDVGAISI